MNENGLQKKSPRIGRGRLRWMMVWRPNPAQERQYRRNSLKINPAATDSVSVASPCAGLKGGRTKTARLLTQNPRERTTNPVACAAVAYMAAAWGSSWNRQTGTVPRPRKLAARLRRLRHDVGCMLVRLHTLHANPLWLRPGGFCFYPHHRCMDLRCY